MPFLFSPNFTYQFEINFHLKHFVIIQAATRFVYMTIPADLLSIDWNNLEKKAALQLICSRFKWESERTFRIVNRSNMDCLFEMCTRDGKQDKDIKNRYLKLLSCVKVDNHHENMYKLDSPHLLLDRHPLEDRDVLERLIRMNQSYKTSLSHALNTNQKGFKLLQQINRVDFSQPWTLQDSSFDIENSFTSLDWRIIELVEDADTDFEIKDIEKEQRLQLCFNILPNGRSILHNLASSTNSQDAYFAAIDILNVAS